MLHFNTASKGDSDTHRPADVNTSYMVLVLLLDRTGVKTKGIDGDFTCHLCSNY